MVLYSSLLFLLNTFLFQLLSYIIGGMTWFAGLIYLLENSGDPWKDFSPEHRAEPGSFDYLDAIWFLMVTCSTVGYGDVSPKTVLGKIAVMFFLCSETIYYITLHIIYYHITHCILPSILLSIWLLGRYQQDIYLFTLHNQ